MFLSQMGWIKAGHKTTDECKFILGEFNIKTNLSERHFHPLNNSALKWYYDKNRIFPIESILKHKQVVCMRRKVPFTFFKYLFSFQRYSSF